MPKSWKLSPSDLTFLWDECPRCFYLKVVNGFNRPSLPMPKIFTRIDLIMKGYYAGKPSSALSPIYRRARFALETAGLYQSRLNWLDMLGHATYGEGSIACSSSWMAAMVW